MSGSKLREVGLLILAFLLWFAIPAGAGEGCTYARKQYSDGARVVQDSACRKCNDGVWADGDCAHCIGGLNNARAKNSLASNDCIYAGANFCDESVRVNAGICQKCDAEQWRDQPCAECQ